MNGAVVAQKRCGGGGHGRKGDSRGTDWRYVCSVPRPGTRDYDVGVASAADAASTMIAATITDAASSTSLRTSPEAKGASTK